MDGTVVKAANNNCCDSIFFDKLIRRFAHESRQVPGLPPDLKWDPVLVSLARCAIKLDKLFSVAHRTLMEVRVIKIVCGRVR